MTVRHNSRVRIEAGGVCGPGNKARLDIAGITGASKLTSGRESSCKTYYLM